MCLCLSVEECVCICMFRCARVWFGVTVFVEAGKRITKTSSAAAGTIIVKNPLLIWLQIHLYASNAACGFGQNFNIQKTRKFYTFYN